MLSTITSQYVTQFVMDLFILAYMRKTLRFCITHHLLPRLSFRWPSRYPLSLMRFPLVSLAPGPHFFPLSLVQKRQITYLKRKTVTWERKTKKLWA